MPVAGDQLRLEDPACSMVQCQTLGLLNALDDHVVQDDTASHDLPHLNFDHV